MLKNEKVAENFKSCRKVAEQLVAKPNREPVKCKLLCYSVLSRENLTVPALKYSVLFALRQSRVDFMTFQTID